jgi:hypothetical protein
MRRIFGTLILVGVLVINSNAPTKEDKIYASRQIAPNPYCFSIAS